MDRLKAALFIWLLLATSAAAQVCGTVSGCPTASTPFNGTELIYTVQGGVSKQTTIGAILDQAAAITSPLIVGTTPIQGTTGGYLLFANGPLLGAEPVASLSIATSQLTGILRAAQFPALTGDVTTVAGALATTISAGAVTNAKLANASTTVNGQTCTLGSTCTITATAATITVGTTAIMAGTSGGIEFNNAGVLGEKGVTGTGNVVLASSPTLVTPALGTPSALTLTNATGLPIAGITGLGTGVGTALAASVTGSGGIVLATAPSISGLTVTGSFTATGLVTNADLANSSLTIGSTNIALGATQTTLAGLSSVTSTTFVGSLTGHASLDCALAGCTITGPTSIAGLTVTGSFTATGLVTNADLANASTTVNGVVCTLGSTCTITASAGTITPGSTTVASGTNGGILFDNGGTLGNTAAVAAGNIITGNGASGPQDSVIKSAQLPGADLCINCGISISIASNNLTVTLTSASGAALSATNQAQICFRSDSTTNAELSCIALSSGPTVTLNAGSTLGVPGSSANAFRVWIALFNNSGTVSLGVQVATNYSTPSIKSLNEWVSVSTTACSACSTATAAQTWYTTGALTTVPFRTVAFAEFAAWATAGNWATPTAIHMCGVGCTKPGDVLQNIFATSAVSSTPTNTSFNNVGASISITPSNAANLIEVDGQMSVATLATSITGVAGMFRSGVAGTQLGQGFIVQANVTGLSVDVGQAPFSVLDAPNTTSSTSYQFGGKCSTASDCVFSGHNGSNLRVREIMG